MSKEERELMGSFGEMPALKKARKIEGATAVSEPQKKARVAKEEVPTPKDAPKEAAPKKDVPTLKKLAKKPLTERERFVRLLLKRAGLSELPKLESMFDKDAGNATKKVKDIAIFIQKGEGMLEDVSKECPHKNVVNLSSEVLFRQVKSVAMDVFHSKRFYHVIEVSNVTDAPEGVHPLQCVSGRHRLALIALLWGSDAEVPVRLTSRSMCECRDSVVFANKSRATSSVEKADLVMVQAVNGDTAAKPDEVYEKVVRTKTSAVDFAFHRAIHNHIYGFKFEFDVSMRSTIDDCMTMANSIKGFLKSVVTWEPSMTRIQLDTAVKDALKWLNALAKEFNQTKGFVKEQQMAQHPLIAYGDIYRSNLVAGKDPMEIIPALVKKAVSLGDIGREKTVKLVNMLTR